MTGLASTSRPSSGSRGATARSLFASPTNTAGSTTSSRWQSFQRSGPTPGKAATTSSSTPRTRRPQHPAGPRPSSQMPNRRDGCLAHAKRPAQRAARNGRGTSAWQASASVSVSLTTRPPPDRPTVIVRAGAHVAARLGGHPAARVVGVILVESRAAGALSGIVRRLQDRGLKALDQAAVALLKPGHGLCGGRQLGQAVERASRGGASGVDWSKAGGIRSSGLTPVTLFGARGCAAAAQSGPPMASGSLETHPAGGLLPHSG